MTDSEHGIALAAERYRKQGRADIRKTEARSIIRAGHQIWTGKGDTDFVGDVLGRTWRLEVKETHRESFPLSDWPEHQRATMQKAAERGCEVRLVLVFRPSWEAYSVAWPELQAFVVAPWRQSIARAMACAWGLLLPVEPTTKPGRVRLMFLDGADHPRKKEALAVVEAERLANPLELFAEDSAEWRPKKRKKPEAQRAEFIPGENLILNGKQLAKFGRKHGVKAKNWGGK